MNEELSFQGDRHRPGGKRDRTVSTSRSLPCGVSALAALAVPLILAAAGCRGSAPLAPSDAPEVLAHQTLDAPDPGASGPHPVRFLYYGSGSDRQRAEYRDSVEIVTSPVDASKLVELGDLAEERKGFWGFGPDSFPLNGRVWHPEGEGPFPLVLVAHGNHNPRNFSDPGYGWLGELLASRGFIVASLDMNFLNGALRQENDARGWMFLKHLEAWREFHGAEGNPFHGRVDLDRIALVGHSRGGEAVAHAVAFNRLERYPDDASLEFDFGFEIRAVVAMAPVDGQYRPTDRLVPLRDVNYLTFHGSHDGDVTSFHGLRPYQRLEFTEPEPRFKAAVYVYRANHGQWNTVWGAHDRGPRSARILDLRPLLDPEEQRRFGGLYISAFLEATVRGEEAYLPLFRDHRVAGRWLPKTMYVTRLHHSTFQPLATFEEDIDLTTGTAPGVTLRGERLSRWSETDLKLRSRNRPETPGSQENQVVRLGWNNQVREGEGIRDAEPAAYALHLPPDAGARWELDEEVTLDFHLAFTDERPPPRAPTGEDGDPDAAVLPSADPEEGAEGVPGEELPAPDLSVEVVDASGRSARAPVSRYGPLRRPLPASVLRRKDHEEERFDGIHEVILQSYHLPLSDFRERNPELEVEELRTVRFVFDRTPAGTVVLDDVGFSRPGEGFLGARISAGNGGGGS